MRFFFVLIFIFSCFVGCNSHRNSKEVALYERDTLPNHSIRYRPNYSINQIDTRNIELSFFETIPETIPNFLCELYSYDTTKLVDGKYIFLTDLTEYSIIKVGGKDIYLRKEHEKCSEISENTFKDVYSGNGFTIVFIHKPVDYDTGISYEKGTLEIKNSKHQVTFKIHGGHRINVTGK